MDMKRSENHTNLQLEQFGVDLSIHEHDFGAGKKMKVGSRVRVIRDDDFDHVKVGDEGVVVGFFHVAAARKGERNYNARVTIGNADEFFRPVVEFSDKDPDTVDPNFLEVI